MTDKQNIDPKALKDAETVLREFLNLDEEACEYFSASDIQELPLDQVKSRLKRMRKDPNTLVKMVEDLVATHHCTENGADMPEWLNPAASTDRSDLPECRSAAEELIWLLDHDEYDFADDFDTVDDKYATEYLPLIKKVRSLVEQPKKAYAWFPLFASVAAGLVLVIISSVLSLNDRIVLMPDVGGSASIAEEVPDSLVPSTGSVEGLESVALAQPQSAADIDGRAQHTVMLSLEFTRDLGKAQELQRSPMNSAESGAGRTTDHIEKPQPHAPEAGGDIYTGDSVPERLLACHDAVIIPAVYETKFERVPESDTSGFVADIPAKYEIVTERVLIKPASSKLVNVAAEYRTVTEHVLDEAAYTEWRYQPQLDPGQRVVESSDTGSVHEVTSKTELMPLTASTDISQIVYMCLVEVPATYKLVTKQVLIQPASTKVVEVPAEYGMIETAKLVRSASGLRVAKPGEHEEILIERSIADETIEIRPVLCQDDMTPKNIESLQTKLQNAGCYRGKIDGVVGPLTLDATNCYANQNGLPISDRSIPLEILESLHLRFDASAR